MGSTRFDIEKFTGRNDFSMWRLKMRALLVQNGLEEALAGEEKMSETLKANEKKDILAKAHSALILSLGDKVLQEVSKETTAAAIWVRLEHLYMTKFLANRLFLKQKLYTFKMISGKSIEYRIDDFNKIVLDLENIEIKVEDEDQELLLF